MIESGYNNRQLALILAVETLKQTDWIDRNQAKWVIEQAEKYEKFLEESTNIINASDRCNIVLASQGNSSVATILAFERITGKSAAESRALVSGMTRSPCYIKENISVDEADLIKKQFSSLGAETVIEKVK
jgi:ribosomal protein L7/L12